MSDDEITRLRAELAAANTRMSKLDFERTAAELERDALRADFAAVTEERDRMRDALRPLAAITLWTDKYPDGPLSVDDNQRYISPQWIVRARAALEGVTEKSGAGNE